MMLFGRKKTLWQAVKNALWVWLIIAVGASAMFAVAFVLIGIAFLTHPWIAALIFAFGVTVMISYD